jgi:integrase/recombinase XerC
MQLLFDVGLRKGEARNLRLMHVGPEEVRILRGKGGKDRVVPATVNVSQKVSSRSSTASALGTISGTHAPAAARSSPARRRSATDHLTAGGVAASTRLTCATATRTSPGTSFATRWLRRGGRITTLSTAMGHASLATTYDLYGHLDTRDLVADLALITARSQRDD